MFVACSASCIAPGCTPAPDNTGPIAASPSTHATSGGPRSTPPRRAGVVPPRFHGEWNRNVADCGSGLNDSRLMLSADRVGFHESTGRILSTTHYGANEVGISLEMSGEGERWAARYRFRLSHDGRELTDVGNGGRWVRYRCE